jgi:hypothetical protein
MGEVEVDFEYFTMNVKYLVPTMSGHVKKGFPTSVVAEVDGIKRITLPVRLICMQDARHGPQICS